MFIEVHEIRDDELIRVCIRPDFIVGVEEDRGQALIWASYPQAYRSLLVSESVDEVLELVRGL